MSLTIREFWTAIHGMMLGAGFLLSFSGGLVGLYNLKFNILTLEGLRINLVLLKWGMSIMAVFSWLTVITGTYIVYPWYRAAPPEGADLSLYPRSFLKANPALSGWHVFGMEWKEHVAWISPIVATAVAYLVWKYGPELIKNPKFKKIVVVLFVLSFLTAAVAGLLGALITKAAPIL